MFRKARRGFTMIEMVVAIAIVAILAAIAAPAFLRQKPEQNLKEAATELAANVRYARSLAVSGATIGTMIPDAIELRFDVATNSYTTVAVQGATVGTLKVVRMADYHPGQLTMAVTAVGATTIRFQRNGAADKVALVTLTEGLTGRNRTVEITRAGLARLQ